MGRRNTSLLAGILFPVVIVAVLLCFLTGVSNLGQGSAEEDKQQLETALRRASVACYAAEGIYPPDLAYLEEHYGLRIDKERYTVMYEAYGSNLMPDITILDNDV